MNRPQTKQSLLKHQIIILMDKIRVQYQINKHHKFKEEKAHHQNLKQDIIILNELVH